jgi:hypothetical protein
MSIAAQGQGECPADDDAVKEMKSPAAFKSKLPFWMFWYMERAVRKNASSTLSPVFADASM